MVYGSVNVQAVNPSDGLFYGAKSELGKVFAHFFCDVLKKIDDKFGFPAIAASELFVLCSHSDGARVEVADPHHYAPGYD